MFVNRFFHKDLHHFFSAIVCGWEGSNLYEFDLRDCNKLYAAMTCVLVGGICGESQCVGMLA